MTARSMDVQREDVQGMTPEAWFEKRRQMSEHYGVPEREIPAEAVWYIPHPDLPVTDADRERAAELAEQLRAQGVVFGRHLSGGDDG